MQLEAKTLLDIGFAVGTIFGVMLCIIPYFLMKMAELKELKERKETEK